MANSKKSQQVQTNTPGQEKLFTMPIKARINACRPADAGKGQNRNPWEDETFQNNPCDLFDAAKPFLHMLTEQPMRSNPFSLIHRQKDIDAFVFALVRMTTWRADKCDLYWNVVYGHLYHALVGYVYYYGTLEEQNLKTVLGLLKEIQYEEEGAADLLFQNLAESDPDDLTVFYYHQFKDATQIAQKGVWIACASLLRSFELFPAFGAGAGEYYPISCDTADDDEEDWDGGIPDEYMEDDDLHDAEEHLSPFVTEDRMACAANEAIQAVYRAHFDHPEKMPDTDLETLRVLAMLFAVKTAGDFQKRFPVGAEKVEDLLSRILSNATEKATFMSRRVFSRKDVRVLKSLWGTLYSNPYDL